MTTKAITPLRQRMIEDMTARKRYAHVATGMISAVESPLDQLARAKERPRKTVNNRKEDQPPA